VPSALIRESSFPADARHGASSVNASNVNASNVNASKASGE
jgi:hypothetical protein